VSHTATFKKDPLADRKSVIESQKGFKGSSMPKSGFKSNAPKTATDPSYTPFKGKVKR
jgi:hypothetical protein